MFRYYIIATAIVLAVGCIAGAVHLVRGDSRVAGMQSTASPSPPRGQAASTLDPGEVTGSAPWAFDAVIDCFRHQRTFKGTLQHVRGQVPLDARPLQQAWEIASGPCSVVYSGDSARIVRGSSANPSVDVAVPPHLRIFVEGGQAEGAPGLRLLYVLRWTTSDAARLDRLATMPDGRLLPASKLRR